LLKDSGGIKDIIIDKEDVSENVATINYTVKLGNGASKSGSTRFVKEDRKWKLYEDQMPVASAP
jgi:CMP-2-keto-3-deoxyoctulosonic acid synthetase